jgi:EF hand
MPQVQGFHRISRLTLISAALLVASLAHADDMVSFATGGYARGLRTKAMMHKIDTDGDGTVSHDEFIAYQSKVFDMMDKTKSGSLGPQEFLRK